MHVPSRSTIARHVRRGLPLFVALMAVPSAASAATGPLLSLTPERVSNGHLALAGQPWRVRVVMQPWVEGQTATVRFYPHGHKLRVVNVNLTMSPTGKSGMAVVAFGTSKPGTVASSDASIVTPCCWMSRCVVSRKYMR